MLVFVSHCGLEGYVPGAFGVTVFFFLSGYLITTLMRVEFTNNASINLRHFWLRRALRILPPFYLVLAAAILGGLAFDPPGTLSGPAVAAQLLHVTNYWIVYHGYDGQPAGTGVYWSLAVEEHFYLLFPWLYWGMQKLKLARFRQALLLWTLCALILLWRCLLVYHFHASISRTYMATDTRVDSILFGCALAVWQNPMLDELRLNIRRWKYAIVPGALGIIALSFVIRDPGFRETARYSLQGIALTFIFIAAIKLPAWLPFRVLNWRPVAFVGLLSYSLYLLHYAVIYAVPRMVPGLNPVLRGVASFAVSMALAWAIYMLIERSCARLRRALID